MMTAPLRVRRAVAVFYCAAMLLFSSGRLASSDAAEQLKVALLLAETGSVSVDPRAAADGTESWIIAPNGRRYQVHDIGNVLLMLPGAAVAARLSARPVEQMLVDPPVLARVLGALMCTGLAALAATWMFTLLAGTMPVRQAFWLSLLFPFATIFIAYARSAWDVLGACTFFAGALRYSADALRGSRPGRALALAAGALGLACMFRYSLLPFFGPVLLYLMWRLRGQLSHASLFAVAAVLVMTLSPSLIYNLVRTGEFWRPATAAAALLEGQNRMNGEVAGGAFGLLFSPNRGLFVFSPLLLLVFAVPLVWRQIDPSRRVILVAYGFGAAAYLLLVGSLQNWATFGWGPRYLVPVLPLIFLASASSYVNLWSRARRKLMVLACASWLLAVPPSLVNWHLATTAFTDAARPHDWRPVQQLAAWKALLMGIRGEDLPVPAGAARSTLEHSTAAFPDLLLVRVARLSTAGLLAVLAVIAACVLAMAGAARSILRV